MLTTWVVCCLYAAVPQDVVKFYVQRHILFEKFEDGIQLDHESWYSVRMNPCCHSLAVNLLTHSNDTAGHSSSGR